MSDGPYAFVTAVRGARILGLVGGDRREVNVRKLEECQNAITHPHLFWLSVRSSDWTERVEVRQDFTIRRQSEKPRVLHLELLGRFELARDISR